MTAASAAAVEAAQKELGCERQSYDGIAFRDGRCVQHRDSMFTDRGCPVAVRVADAVVEAQG